VTDDEIQREIDASMLGFLLDDWGVLESELYDRLDLPGCGLITSFGAGAQGIVYMTEDGGFVKITEAPAEAAFAFYIRDEAMPDFPAIRDVRTFELGTTRLFAIYRESVDDMLGPFPDEELSDLVREAMEGAARTTPPDYRAMDTLRDVAPGLHREITTLLDSLAGLLVQTDFGVTDLHSDNIGRTDDGCLVVRDFGMNTLSTEMIARAIHQIGNLPEPSAATLAA
jgi:hypothetical protein